ncbi:aprataxin and PNK-like factor [Anneissia japonica]|uniref:aprataxin and PNK-like factor n=1 Tax=Anneissia japonica TaxID=1529436 RepID=UPI0014259F93|nr:aprataxin and PNK-like factor [Anneissia japonica]
MSGVELKICDGEARNNILIPIGKTVIGRGPFLSVGDKRVSRNHAILEVDDGKLKIMSTHTNPTFFLEGASDNLTPLPKDTWHNLGNGDRFSLLPDQHIYEVVIDDRPINKDSQGFSLSPTKNKEEELEKVEDDKNELEEGENKKNGDPSTPQENKSNGQQKGNENDTEDDKEQDQTAEIKPDDENVVVLPSGKPVALPLNKPRNLPAWMLGSDTTPTTKDSPKGRGRGRGKKSNNSDEVADATPTKPKPKGRGRGRGKKTDATTKPTPRKVPKREVEYLDDWMGSEDEDDDDDEGSDWEEENKKEQAKRRGSQSRFPRSPTKKSPRKRSKRTSSDEEIDDLMDEEVYIPRPTKRGRNASRSSYSQSVDEDDEEVAVKPKKDVKRGSAKEESQETQRTPCTYGKTCYRKNKKHLEEFSHYGDDDYPKEEADDNEDGEEKEDEKDLPECPYGSECYRLASYEKSNRSTRPKRKASEIAKKNVNACEEEDEDDGPNTYDRNDSFIADSEQSPYEPASEESDYNPEDDSEDVRTLTKEARSFIKNKKMHKKVH